MKLAQHTFSGLFGTFLFNSLKDAIKNGCDPNDTDEHRHRCFQVWSYLGKHNTEYLASFKCFFKLFFIKISQSCFS